MPAPTSLGAPQAPPPQHYPTSAPPAASPPQPPSPPLTSPPSPVASAAAATSGSSSAANSMVGNQSNTATLVMGPTGSGKSSLLATLADYIYSRYGKVLLLASCDGGGVPMEIQKRIATGKIRFWRMATRDPGNRLNLAWDTMIKAALGWWPMEINPATGECPIGVALMPPVATMMTMCCPNGHVVKQTTKQNDLVATICPRCNTLVSDTNMRVERVSRQPAFFRDVGGIALEGLTSMCAWGEEDLGNRAARGDLEGMKGAIGGAVTSGDYVLGQVTMSHVGFIQQQARTLVLNSQSIPGLVVPPVFTSLTLDATVEGTRICGPQLSGKAKTDVAPAWFGNVLEAEKREVGGKYQYRLWLTQWREATGVVHLCKNRASPGILPEYLEDPVLSGGAADQATAFSRFSLGAFFEMLDAGLQKGIEKELQGRAAVVNEMVRYEDPFQGLAAPVVGAAAAGGGGGPVGLVPAASAGPASLPPSIAAGPPSLPPAMGNIQPAPPQAPAAAPAMPAMPVQQALPPPPQMPLAPAMPLAAPPTVAPPPGRRMAPPAAAPGAPVAAAPGGAAAPAQKGPAVVNPADIPY